MNPLTLEEEFGNEKHLNIFTIQQSPQNRYLNASDSLGNILKVQQQK